MIEGAVKDVRAGGGAAEGSFEIRGQLGKVGILRLRDRSAAPTGHFAQDDRTNTKCFAQDDKAWIKRFAQDDNVNTTCSAEDGNENVEDRAQSKVFEEFCRELLRSGKSIRFQARGGSMSPAIRDGEMVQVECAALGELRRGDIVLVKGEAGFRLHRLVVADAERDVFITRGDCGQQDDPAVSGEQIVGVAIAKEVRVGTRMVRAQLRGLGGRVVCCAARGQRIAARLLERAKALTSGTKDARVFPFLLAVLFVLLAASYSIAQVAVDAETNANATMTGAGSHTLTFTHTTTATANRLLIVSVSMNITAVPGTTVTGVTYNGTTVNFVGAQNDAGNTRRVEMWSLTAPLNGGPFPVVVTVNLPAAGSVGVAAGAITFTDADQTTPLETFVSENGAAGAYSQVDIPGVVNGMVFDTLSTDGTQTVTQGLGTQTIEWNIRSAMNANPGVRGVATTRSGAPSVPNSDTFSGTSNWVDAGIGINPSTADIGVTTSVTAVPFGQNSTYNITVFNNGPSAANSVVLTDTYAAAGLTLISVTPSAGTTCPTTAPTITCNLPTSFASGAIATIAVVVSTTAAGFYPNTAAVHDTSPPPDPNTGNNTYTALAPVVSVVCSGATLSAGGTLTGAINTYYPGTASVAVGATSIPVGTATGAVGTIANGSELLVIQMQDASINDSQSVVYGNGSTGTGFTTINNAGNYEWVTATGPIAGGFVPIKGAGPGGGLVFGYTSAAASATKGLSTYQVVLVPQYLSASLGALVATAWNGSTGGIVALDIAGQLNLNGGSVVVDGQGFRGGAGMQLTGAAGANTDYWQTAPATYTGAAGGEAGVDAAKGEGVAGTPEWVEFNLTFLQTTSNYPSGTAGTDGSMARGAPGNAGGGGTDADPGANDDNAGGGGGGNGGAGGFGGDSWNSNLSTGGEGGSPFPATIDRIAMGGGGGAGSRNNSDGDNQASGGATGGGIIFIRADSLTGTGTLTANGAAAYNGTDKDAGGGGGAGGTIVVLAANGGEGGLTLQANGGRGGNAWQANPYTLANRHGPGGGGGGGVVLVSGTPASISLTGGANGLTETPGVPYGATVGAAGTSVTNATLSQVTGMQSSAVCVPDMTVAKTHAGNFTRGSSASFTVTASNVSALGATSGVVTVNDTLPLGLIPTSASGTGWTCTVSGQTESCTRADSLAALGSYPAITVNASVAQSAPATVTNTAVVGGGGEANLLNDTATDTANVGSSADMAVTDAGTPTPTVAAGANITYTQVVTNNGPSAADNATLVASIPANTTLVSAAAPAGWSCNYGAGGTGNVVCTNANMAAVTSGTFTIVVKVNTGTPNGTVITGTAAVGSAAVDPNSANNTASVTTIVGSTGPNLSVSNVETPVPVQAGNTITYTQVVTNTGTTAVTGATFSETDTPPGNLTFISVTPPAGWTCTGFPVSACADPSVGAGVSGTFTVVYRVNAGTGSGTAIVDTATVTGTNQSYGANSAVANDVVAAATQADLVLSTTGAPSTVLAGNDITYTQTVTNNGPAAATNASFTEATPTNTTYASVIAPAGWTCTTPAVGGTGNVTCTDPTFAVGDAANIVVVVNVPASVVASTITANSTLSATNSVNISSTTVVTTVGIACDLAVTNSGVPSPVTAGATITYTQTVTNLGPSNCSSGTFTEATPANTAWVSDAVVTTGGGTWVCPNAAPVSCTNGSVPPGSVGTITAVYTVAAGTAAGTLISDTVTAATTSKDTNPANNTATVTIAVTAATQADLSVTNAGSPNPVTAGTNITYTQSLTNHGPATAAAPVFTETLPANTVEVSLTGPAGWTCAGLTCTDTTTMAANTTANFTFVVTVNSGVAQGTTITQTDSVTSTTGDPNPGNNSATVNVQVADSADLAVTNTAAPIPVLATGTITYTQVVTNNGPSAATSVVLTDMLPANTTLASLTGPAGWTCTPATFTCTDPSLAPGSATITYTVTVNAGTAAGTAIKETASVSSAVTDPNLANNSATAADVVATNAQADLIMTNVAAPTSVAAGSNITYTQGVTNNGPAAATAGMTITETTPPNTTFVSMTPPAGWTCGTLPAVGGAGTITCTDSTALALNGSASFTLVLQVNSVAPSGTNITDTVTATAADIVPSLTTNTASATVVVANPGSVDMSIVKTGTPNPVTEGTPLTYTLTVTNNSTTTSATNVTVTDSLPSVETYLSTSTTQGTCSEAGGTVTCLLGTMANSTTATISILTIPGATGFVTNTASVAADQTDPNPGNNTSTQTETVTAPTRIALQSFSAHTGTDKNGASRVVLMWKTGGEAHNLGFNVYREQNGNRVRMNPSVIAGSALLMSGALSKHAGRSYAWIDPAAGVTGASYWLEDIDVNGTRTMHGPVAVSAGASGDVSAGGEVSASETRMLSQMNQALPATPGSQESHVVETVPLASAASPGQIQKQFELAARPAVKIYVRHEGWYQVTQPDLVKAGLDPNVDPALLHLYAEAIEQPLQITGATAGPGGFGAQAAINFYGTGINTPFSGTRVYWLVAGEGRGARIPQLPVSSGSNQPPGSYSSTVELQQHTIYFAALLTQNDENFFGALVSPTPVEQVLATPSFSPSAQNARLDVALRGVITGFPHDVSVVMNGTPLGDVMFNGQDEGTLRVNIPAGVLQSSNTVTLTAHGDYDTSLVDYIRITYPRMYVAENDQLKFTGRAGDELMISNFANPPAVLDITDPNRPVELTPQVIAMNGKYEVAVQVPFTTTNPANPIRHTLVAVAADRIASAAGVWPHHPSRWHSAQAGADIAMVTYGAFESTLAPLVRAHQAEGKTSAVVPINDLYDEFNFGERSPFAIRWFLQAAKQNWKKAPGYLLLNGRASFDPRNYLGFGNLDLVPTRILPSSSLMTASDDWFSDFSDAGMPRIATGRLPVSTVDEATTVVGKIVTYEGQSTNGPWTGNALMVADNNDTENFTQDSQTVQAQLPAAMQVTDVFTGTVGATAAQGEILTAINSGQGLVNYLGHGSEEQWSGSNIFDNNSVSLLTNGSQLPVFLIMDCLNGFFQDVYEQPLGVTLMLASNGGGVAVLASSGLNQAPPQTALDVLVVQNALSAKGATLGDAIVKAKAQISDADVRRTYILFGDPAMQVKQAPASAAGSPASQMR